MSNSINFRFTQAGRTATFNANNTGVSLTLTHIQLGSGNKTPAGTETALLLPKQTALFASGSTVNIGQIRMSAIFTGASNFGISEVGLWAGDPAAAGSVLVAYWAQGTGVLAYKSPGVDFVFSHDMLLNTDIPVGALTIQADHAQSPMLAIMGQHNALQDPHPQYATDADLAAHVAAADPHPQYETPAETAAKIAAHESAGNPHPQYATDADLAAHTAAADPHPQYAKDTDLALVVPAGVVIYRAANAAPEGYLKANGAAISRATYAALFSVIGTAYGAGDGASTFNLPDLRGEFLRGFDDGRGVDANRTFGSVQTSQNLSHSHGGGTGGAGAHSHSAWTDSQGNHTHYVAGVGGQSDYGGFHELYGLNFGVAIHVTGSTNSAGVHSHNVGVSASADHWHAIGADGGSEARPRNVALLPCIKY
jgi:microcystin-dependent protein